MNNCPFCNLDKIQNEIIIKNDLCLFLQREEVVLNGSGLIIPRAHRETIFDLTPAEWNATYEMIHHVKKLVDENFQNSEVEF